MILVLTLLGTLATAAPEVGRAHPEVGVKSDPAPPRPPPPAPFWTEPFCPAGTTAKGELGPGGTLTGGGVRCLDGEQRRHGPHVRARSGGGVWIEHFERGRAHGDQLGLDAAGNVVMLGHHDQGRPVGRWGWWASDGTVLGGSDADQERFPMLYPTPDGRKRWMLLDREGDVYERVEYGPDGTLRSHAVFPGGTPLDPTPAQQRRTVGYAWLFSDTGRLQTEFQSTVSLHPAGDPIEWHGPGKPAAVGAFQGDGWHGTVWYFHPDGWLQRKEEGWQYGAHCGKTTTYDAAGAVTSVDDPDALRVGLRGRQERLGCR